MKPSMLLTVIAASAITLLNVLSGCSPTNDAGRVGGSGPQLPSGPPQAADPSAVIVYGCGVNKRLKLEATNGMGLSSLLDKVVPLPRAVNSVLIRFANHSTSHYFALSQVSPTNSPGTWVVTNGMIIILAHTDQFPLDNMQDSK